MISISGKIWKQEKINKNLVEKVKQDYGFGDILSHLIISRNYDASEIYGIENNQKIINFCYKFQSYLSHNKNTTIIDLAYEFSLPVSFVREYMKKLSEKDFISLKFKDEN